MITVRYPNGQTVRYNDAHQTYTQSNGDHHIYTGNKDQGGTIIAVVQGSAGAVLEWTRPCEVSNPLTGFTNRTAAKHVLDNLRQCDSSHLAALKRALTQFDSRTFTWKD